MTTARLGRAARLLGALGLAAAAAGWSRSPGQFAHAWLAAMTAWIGWPLGSLALLFIHALSGGKWGMTLRGELAAGVGTLPWVIPGLVPLLLLARHLYPWLDPRVAAGLGNRFYLNAPFACARIVLYLVVWLGLAHVVRRSRRAANPGQALRAWAPGGLILLALTVSFAAIDATLSLEPRFESSIYGWIACCQALLLALSAAVLIKVWAGRETMPADVGRLLLALVVLWAYLDFMQFLIVWSSNLPREAAWYAPRLDGAWGRLAVVIALLHFLLPLLVLIWPPAQRSSRVVAAVATLLVAMEVARAWWIVIPAAGRVLSWTDAAAMLAVWPSAAAMALSASSKSEEWAHGA